MATKAKAPNATEHEMVAMLRKRYEQDSGNGPQGAIVPQVRDAARFSATRTIDALAFSFWPSRGLEIEAFECKSSRSDFRREMESPAKAERFGELVDRFWIVAGGSDVVQSPDELPAPWGLLVARGGKLVQIKPAARLRPATGPKGTDSLPPEFDRGFLIAIVRQAARVAGLDPEEVTAARAAGHAEGVEEGERTAGNYRRRYEELDTAVQDFERASGIVIRGYRSPTRDPGLLGKAVRAVISGDHELNNITRRLDQAAREAERLAEWAREHADKAAQTLAEWNADEAQASLELTTDGES